MSGGGTQPVRDIALMQRGDAIAPLSARLPPQEVVAIDCDHMLRFARSANDEWAGRWTMLINRICVALAAISILCVASAAADPYCSPGSNSARILTKPAPNALHPDWRGDNFVGTGWTLIPKKIV